MAWGPDGELIYLLGDDPRRVRRVRVGARRARPPRRAAAAPWTWRRSGRWREILVAGSRDGCSPRRTTCPTAGSSVALVEMALRAGRRGAVLGAATGWTRSSSCSPSRPTRAVVVVPRSEELRFTEMCAARGFPATRIGVVDSGIGAESGLGVGEQALVIDGVLRRVAGAGARRGAGRRGPRRSRPCSADRGDIGLSTTTSRSRSPRVPQLRRVAGCQRRHIPRDLARDAQARLRPSAAPPMTRSSRRRSASAGSTRRSARATSTSRCSCSTPRKPTSMWSARNKERLARLLEAD